MQKIGFIDWVEREINLFIFERRGKEYVLVDTVSHTLEGTPNVQGELNSSVLTNFKRTDIEHTYLSVPATLLSIRELTVPFTDKNKIRDIIPYELEGLLISDINNYCTDYLVIESSKDGSRLLTASVEKTKLRDIIENFSSIGLEPEVITSLDLKLSKGTLSAQGEIERLFENPVLDRELRIKAVSEELTSPSINLRQDELSYTGDIERVGKALRTTALLLLILLMIFSASTVIRFISLKGEKTILTREIKTLYLNAFPHDTRIVDASRQFKANLSALRERKVIVSGIPLLETMLEVAQLKNQNITLYEFRIDSENVFLKGSAVSFEEIDSFKNALSSSFITKIIESKSSPDRKVNFTIAMRRKTT